MNTMRKAIALMLAILFLIPATGYALDLRKHVIKEQKPVSTKQTVVEKEVPITTAFVCMVRVFNECYPFRQIDNTILEDTWKLAEMPKLYSVPRGYDCFGKLERIRDIYSERINESYRGYSVKVYHIKNTQSLQTLERVYPVNICTAEELKKEIADKKVAYVHIGENSDDKAYAVIGIKGNKAIAFDGKSNVEIGFDELVAPANYILVFNYGYPEWWEKAPGKQKSKI